MSKVSQVQIAQHFNVASNTVNRWFKGKQFPQPEDIDQLAELMGVSSTWLMGGETSEKPSPETIIKELRNLLNVPDSQLPEHIPNELIQLLKDSPKGIDFEPITLALQSLLGSHPPDPASTKPIGKKSGHF